MPWQALGKQQDSGFFGDGMTTNSMMGIYGNQVLERSLCPECNSFSFVKRGKYVCCGTPVSGIPDKYIRMAAAERGRKPPSQRAQKKILSEQDNRCLYCSEKFGAVKTRKGKFVTLRIEWDHRVPYSYSMDSRNENFVAACHVCNGIKSDKVFDSISSAQVYIMNARRKKGYDF